MCSLQKLKYFRNSQKICQNGPRETKDVPWACWFQILCIHVRVLNTCPFGRNRSGTFVLHLPWCPAEEGWGPAAVLTVGLRTGLADRSATSQPGRGGTCWLSTSTWFHHWIQQRTDNLPGFCQLPLLVSDWEGKTGKLAVFLNFYITLISLLEELTICLDPVWPVPVSDFTR